MRIITYILIFIAIGLGLSFAILNPEPATIHYYIGQATLPLSLLLLLTLCLGLLLGTLLMVFSWFRLKRKMVALKHRIKKLEQV